MDPQLPTFSQVLKAGGYWLGYVGKWEVGTPARPEHFGFDVYVPDKEYLAWRRAEGLPPLPAANGWFGEVDPGITPAQSALGWGADHVIRLLQEAAGQEQPFFLRWDPREPHLPNVLPEPYASLVDPATIPPWPSFPDPLDGQALYPAPAGAHVGAGGVDLGAVAADRGALPGRGGADRPPGGPHPAGAGRAWGWRRIRWSSTRATTATCAAGTG